jgi:hypothetical protein
MVRIEAGLHEDAAAAEPNLNCPAVRRCLLRRPFSSRNPHFNELSRSGLAQPPLPGEELRRWKKTALPAERRHAETAASVLRHQPSPLRPRLTPIYSYTTRVAQGADDLKMELA